MTEFIEVIKREYAPENERFIVAVNAYSEIQFSKGYREGFKVAEKIYDWLSARPMNLKQIREWSKKEIEHGKKRVGIS